MPATIPASHLDLLTTKKAFAHIATIMADGTPQVTPVWVDFDGTHVLFNSAKGRLKDKNLEQRKIIGIAVSDPENPYRYLGLQGKVVEITEEGADAHIDKMAMKYMGKESYPFRTPTEVRRIYKVEIDKVHVMG